MTIPDRGRVAVIGAGPGGLAAAKHALEAGLETHVFEASEDLGGQWHTSARHSGVWPGMHTNTSRAMTAFSDFPAPADHPLHPAALQIQAYLRSYAEHFGVVDHIRFETPVQRVSRGWRVDGEPFDGVIVASGRFRKPCLAPGLEQFRGELLHAFDYPGADAFRNRRVLVYGNGISGLEIASDLAPAASVVSAFRKPRYVIQKVVDGVSSDWQWYTMFGALQRRMLPPKEFGSILRERVIRVAGDPADFGAPAPDPDILTAGLSLCQGYLDQVADGSIVCRPGIAAIEGSHVTFTDGSTERVDAIVSATGYELDIPYLDPEIWDVAGHDLALYQRTLHPDLPGFGAIGQFLAQGPYFPLLELQARWIVGVFTGEVGLPGEAHMRAAMAQPRPPLAPHNALALTLAEELGVAPDLAAHSEIAEPLLFGPMLPPRYRVDGPGAIANAADRFREQLAGSPRAPVDPADIEALPRLGLAELRESLATRAFSKSGSAQVSR